MLLTDAAERETERLNRSRSRVTHPNALPLSGASLMREITGALDAVARERRLKLSADERDDLSQEVALVALTRHREHVRTLSDDDRSERATDALTRGDVGRSYLRLLVSSALRDREGWRTTLVGYRSRAERLGGQSATLVGSRESAEHAEHAHAESGEPRGWLSRAIDAESARQSTPSRLPAVAAADAVALAEPLSVVLADECGVSDDRDRDRIRAAVESACGIPLIRQSERPGARSIATIKRDAAAGAALIRERLSARSLVVLVGIVADAESDERKLLRAARTTLDARTAQLADAAADAVESVRNREYPRLRRTGSEAGYSSCSAEPLSRMSGPRYSSARRKVLTAPSVCATCWKVHPAGYPVGVHPVRSSLN